MHLDLTDEEPRALLKLLGETIEADRYPFSPRTRVQRDILAKFGEMGPKPPPTARAPTPEERNPRYRASTAAASGDSIDAADQRRSKHEVLLTECLFPREHAIQERTA